MDARYHRPNIWGWTCGSACDRDGALVVDDISGQRRLAASSRNALYGLLCDTLTPCSCRPNPARIRTVLLPILSAPRLARLPSAPSSHGDPLATTRCKQLPPLSRLSGCCSAPCRKSACFAHGGQKGGEYGPGAREVPLREMPSSHSSSASAYTPPSARITKASPVGKIAEQPRRRARPQAVAHRTRPAKIERRIEVHRSATRRARSSSNRFGQGRLGRAGG